MVTITAALTVRPPAGAFAGVNARVASPENRFATTALYAPTSLSASPSGHGVVLSWAAGQNGSGYALDGAANGSSSNCAGATLASVGSSAGTSYTDTVRYTPQGTYFCYRVRTSYGPAWASVGSNPTVAARIGFVATSATLANGGVAGALDTGDQITLSFNQPVTTATGPVSTDTVCTTTGGVVLLGSTTTSGSCSAGETVNLGSLSGGTASKGARWKASFAWTNSSTLTVVVGAKISGSIPDVAGSWTFNPTTMGTGLLSGTGAFHVCDTNSGGGNCLPAASGAF